MSSVLDNIHLELHGMSFLIVVYKFDLNNNNNARKQIITKMFYLYSEIK